MRSTVLGVAGGSGAGKTTLVESVAARLGDRATVLWFDEYYHDLAHMDPSERVAVNFDHPDSLDVGLLVEHLDGLLDGRAVDVPVYDFAFHIRTGRTRRVEPRPVVVVDGILVLAFPEIRDRLDLAVFVDAPESVRLGRRLERDVRDRGRTAEMSQAQWAATVGPMYEEVVAPSADHADFRLDGTGDRSGNVARVVDAVDRLAGHLAREDPDDEKRAVTPPP
ncbi:MAG: uridine kinase [Actinomycetota bacterium]|nr:uridine kinase [Actinomycetota bacterium]